MTRHTNSLATTVAREVPASRPTPESVLYILGPSYSGSTLLTLLLAQHPQIATIGELKAATVGRIPDYRCSCGQLLRECALWRDVQARMQRRGFDELRHGFRVNACVLPQRPANGFVDEKFL